MATPQSAAPTAPLTQGRWVGHEVDEPVGLPVMFRCAGEPRRWLSMRQSSATPQPRAGDQWSPLRDLRRGAKESAAVVGRALPPLCKGRWVGHEVDEPVGLPVMFRCAGEPRLWLSMRQRFATPQPPPAAAPLTQGSQGKRCLTKAGGWFILSTDESGATGQTVSPQYG